MPEVSWGPAPPACSCLSLQHLLIPIFFAFSNIHRKSVCCYGQLFIFNNILNPLTMLTDQFTSVYCTSLPAIFLGQTHYVFNVICHSSERGISAFPWENVWHKCSKVLLVKGQDECEFTKHWRGGWRRHSIVSQKCIYLFLHISVWNKLQKKS